MKKKSEIELEILLEIMLEIVLEILLEICLQFSVFLLSSFQDIQTSFSYMNSFSRKVVIFFELMDMNGYEASRAVERNLSIGFQIIEHLGSVTDLKNYIQDLWQVQLQRIVRR